MPWTNGVGAAAAAPIDIIAPREHSPRRRYTAMWRDGMPPAARHGHARSHESLADSTRTQITDQTVPSQSDMQAHLVQSATQKPDPPPQSAPQSRAGRGHEVLAFYDPIPYLQLTLEIITLDVTVASVRVVCSCLYFRSIPLPW